MSHCSNVAFLKLLQQVAAFSHTQNTWLLADQILSGWMFVSSVNVYLNKLKLIMLPQTEYQKLTVEVKLLFVSVYFLYSF